MRLDRRAWLATFAITLAPAVARAGGDSPEAAFGRYVKLINTHDFDLLAREVIAPDAVFVFSDEIHRGLAEVRAAFNRTWAVLPDEVYSMDQVEWLSRGRESAACTFRYAYAGTMQGGRRLEGGGRGMNLLVRRPEGWRIRYEHLTPDTKRPAASSD